MALSKPLVEGKTKLQLQFGIRGTKRVLPLSNHNVAQIFKTVSLTIKDKYGFTFGWYLGIPDDRHSDPVAAAEVYIKGKRHSWRRIIWCLDNVYKTSVADEVMPYAEPPADPSFTVECVTPIFMKLRNWAEIAGYLIIPPARAGVIRTQFSSLNDQQTQAVFYYVNCHPSASWSELATMLYKFKAPAAIKTFKLQLPIPKDPTLTPKNILAELQEVQLWESSESYRHLGMQRETHDNLIRRHGIGAPGKSALVNEYLSQHPYPTWGQIVQLLEKRENVKKARAGLAQEVKDKYMTMLQEEAGNVETRDQLGISSLSEKMESLMVSSSADVHVLPSLPEEEKTNDIKTTINTDHEIDLKDLEASELLGQGSFGVVYRGKWLSKGLNVALKSVFLSIEDAIDAKIMADLGKHPNIIGFFGYARNHPETIIVTALASKGSLYDYLHKEKQIPTQQQSLTWAKQVAFAMAYLHKLGLVHRDLKSSNILLSDDMTAQVCDFGAARMLDVTAQATMVGTQRWMAPEVVNGDPVNKKCDVFSFSLVVWELMEHKIPFHDIDNTYLVSKAITTGERPPISSAWPDYLSALTKQGWSPNPQDRPSFDDIVTSLDNKMYFKR